MLAISLSAFKKAEQEKLSAASQAGDKRTGKAVLWETETTPDGRVGFTITLKVARQPH